MEEGGVAPAPAQATPASVRRELWRETQQQSVGSIEEFCHDTGPRWVEGATFQCLNAHL